MAKKKKRKTDKNLIPFNDDNIDYFLSYFSEEDIDSQYVMMYDLEK